MNLKQYVGKFYDWLYKCNHENIVESIIEINVNKHIVHPRYCADCRKDFEARVELRTTPELGPYVLAGFPTGLKVERVVEQPIAYVKTGTKVALANGDTYTPTVAVYAGCPLGLQARTVALAKLKK